MKSYSFGEVLRLVDLSAAQAKRLIDTRVCRASVAAGRGTGSPRRFSFFDVFEFAIAKSLIAHGVSGSRIEELLTGLRQASTPAASLSDLNEVARAIREAPVPTFVEPVIIQAPSPTEAQLRERAARMAAVSSAFDAKEAERNEREPIQGWTEFSNPRTRNPRSFFAIGIVPGRLSTWMLVTICRASGLRKLSDLSPSILVVWLGDILQVLEDATGDSLVGTIEERAPQSVGSEGGEC